MDFEKLKTLIPDDIRLSHVYQFLTDLISCQGKWDCDGA